MPKILVNEKDKTSPGATGSYSNYTVLLTGFAGRKASTDDAIQPDANGVYEFSSADKFKEIIGLVRPEIVVRKLDTTNDNTTAATWKGSHYGNQMAYELLNLGYSVIYKPIAALSFKTEETLTIVDKVNGKELLADRSKNNAVFKKFVDDVAAVQTESFWEIFKDKASYDFRFVTHGFLASSEPDTATTTRLTKVEEAIAALDTLEAEAKKQCEAQPEESKLTEDDWLERLYTGYTDETTKETVNGIAKSYEGFITNPGADESQQQRYASYNDALTGTKAEKSTLENALDVGIKTDFINKTNGCIASLAKYVVKDNADKANSGEIPGRGDCIALIELDERTYVKTGTGNKAEVDIINAINNMSDVSGDADNGKFCAMTVPSVVYKMTVPNDFGDNRKFPGSFHYLACFINSLKSGFAEWYAAAGYTRGVAGYTIDYTTVKLGEIAINALEPRNIVNQGTDPKFACNVIANFRGSYYLWGNRTAHNLGDANSNDKGDLVASHFLNIRQLCTTIKKQLYVACRRFTFDPNSDTLWFNFVNAIRPTLETMKADQGVRDYKILKVVETNPKKATLKAKIRIIPIEAVEDFDLEVSLEDSFGETTAVVTE